MFKGFLWEFYGVSMRCLEKVYGSYMIFLWNFYWIPVGFHGISMIFLWDYYWISMGCRLYFYGIPMGIQKDVCGIYIGILWAFHDVSMIFLVDFYGISEGML